MISICNISKNGVIITMMVMLMLVKLTPVSLWSKMIGELKCVQVTETFSVNAHSKLFQLPVMDIGIVLPSKVLLLMSLITMIPTCLVMFLFPKLLMKIIG